MCEEKKNILNWSVLNSILAKGLIKYFFFFFRIVKIVF